MPCFVFALVSTNITLWLRAFSMPSLALTTLCERKPPLSGQVELVADQRDDDFFASALVHVFDPAVRVVEAGLVCVRRAYW